MARTFLRQETQIRSSLVYDDTTTPAEAAFETNPTNLETDLNNLRSAVKVIIGKTNWWDVADRSMETLDTNLNTLETLPFLFRTQVLTDVSVTAAQNWEILSVSGSEAPSQTAAVGSVSTEGAVVAFHSGTFGTHALDEVSGPSALRPDNLCEVRDSTTGEPIVSSNGKQIYALLQSEIATDGHTFNDTDQRVQLSFVEENSAGSDLIATPVASIAGKTVNFMYARRLQFQNLTEDVFLSGVFLDRAAVADVTRQNAYTNQGATPVDITGNAILDLEGAGVVWKIRDDAEADLFVITEGSAGGTTEVALEAGVDTFRCDAIVNDFDNGIKVDTGAAGTTINVGITANQIDCGGALKVASGGSGDLSLVGAVELNLTDSYRAGSTWSLSDGIALANSSAEWDAFEADFGEVSLLNAITQALTIGNIVKAYANVTANTNEDTDVSLSDANLDAALGDLSGGTFVDDHDVYFNGMLLRSGANAAANNDVYPGTDLDNSGDGQLKFEFKIKSGDVIAVISRA